MAFTLFKIGILDFTFIDLLDITIVTYIFYRGLLFLKDTRSIQMILGLIVILAVNFLAFWFDFGMVRWLFSNFIIAGVIIMAVVFQPELRRALSLMGESRILRLFIKPEIKGASDAVVAAAEKLSSMHYGALIILERSVKLSSVIESGKRLNSEVSAEILQSIFTPYTPLHDGAVVIRGDVILAASCTLPMTDNPAYRRLYGMRHKAGVGVTEESDAIALIISEETGQISYAFEGKLFRDISPQEMKQILAELFN